MIDRIGRLSGCVAWLALVSPCVADDEPERLEMSKAVVCSKVHGYASFEALPDAVLTPDDKLTIYYEPTGYRFEKAKDGFRAVLYQDGRLRKKGRKEPVWKKDKMFEYEAKSPSPPYRIYMRIDVSIKGLPPGDYEFDIVLHDGLAEDATVRQSVGFKVVAPKPAEATEVRPGGPA